MKKVLTCILGLSAFVLSAKVELPSIFSNHAVLSKHAKVPVWGKAAPGEKVTVTIASQKVSVVAGKNGRWKVFLNLSETGEGPWNMTVNDKVIQDVLIGEVWLCSGQSNMAVVMRNAEFFQQESANPPGKRLRMFAVRNKGEKKPQENCRGAWYVADQKMLGSFSAVSYFFGKKLLKELNRPIALIKAAQGASYIETWMDKENYEKFPSAVKRAERRSKAKKLPPWYRSPMEGYNAMIHPLVPFRLNGVIWYQGESNSRNPEDYDQLFRALITQWRKDFDDPALSFFWCNLAAYRNKSADPAEIGWAGIRQKQTAVLDMPRTGEVILTDAGESADIHPRNKKIPGERLAALALARQYGKNIPCTGPTATRAVRKGAEVVISFKDLEGGLTALSVPETYIIKSKENKTGKIRRNSPGAQLEGFALAGKDNKWFWAEKAQIKGDKVVVSSAKVKAPVKVRFAFQYNPTFNLYNKAGFPAVPFELAVQDK